MINDYSDFRGEEQYHENTYMELKGKQWMRRDVACE